MTSENRLSTREETYTYTLRTMVPIENEETCYHDLSISDQLDDFLEIKNVTVTNETGQMQKSSGRYRKQMRLWLDAVISKIPVFTAIRMIFRSRSA